MFDFLDYVNRLVENNKASKVIIRNETYQQSCARLERESKLKKIKAIERMEAETNPKLKRRMQLYIEEGIYDFKDIETLWLYIMKYDV